MVTNPSLIQQLQVGHIFKPGINMNMVEYIRVEAVPLMNDVHSFCMRYHLKVYVSLTAAGGMCTGVFPLVGTAS